jgi:hypothetical protein
MLLPQLSLLEILSYGILIIPTCYAMIAGAPFVPTEMVQVERMLKAVELKPGMKIYDLGSGDGRLVHRAARDYGAIAGLNFSPCVASWAKFLSLFWWRTKATAQVWKFRDLSDADVVFLLPPHPPMNRMKEHLILNSNRALIVSHAFLIRESNLKSFRSANKSFRTNLGL